jgi:hypothetical protein
VSPEEYMGQCLLILVDYANHRISFLWLVFLYPHLDDVYVRRRHLQGRFKVPSLFACFTHVSRSMLQVHWQVYASLEIFPEVYFPYLVLRCSKI